MRVLQSFLTLAAVSLLQYIPQARAATLCVDSNGAFPCYTRIGDAVAAAEVGDVVRVGPGTYYESVTITRPVSIVTENAVVDATGLSRGFFVDGIGPLPLREVNISGFTVRNARFEGILAANASAVTLSNNTVINNNQAFAGNNCPGLEDFEAASGSSDCGEGIHLLGVDHSVVTNNTVQGNAGGILLSDDTAASYNNLISFNTVSGNSFASGVTLSSNAASLMVQKVGPLLRADGYGDGPPPVSTISFGVYHNTIYGNRSRGNGLASKNGAGVAIYATVTGASAYGNVVVANLLMENALPGVTLHATGSGQNLNDNLIAGNTVVNNGADTQDAATSAATGISVYSTVPATGTMVVGNAVQQEALDVAVQSPSVVQAAFNLLQGSGAGVANAGKGEVIAVENFWSCPNGPVLPQSCSSVTGNNVQFDPWLTMPLPTLPNF